MKLNLLILYSILLVGLTHTTKTHNDKEDNGEATNLEYDEVGSKPINKVNQNKILITTTESELGDEGSKHIEKTIKDNDGNKVGTISTTVYKGKAGEKKAKASFKQVNDLISSVFSNFHTRLSNLFPHKSSSENEFGTSAHSPSLFLRNTEEATDEEKENTKSDEEEHEKLESTSTSNIEEEELEQNQKSHSKSEEEESEQEHQKQQTTKPSKSHSKVDPCVKVNQSESVHSYSSVMKCYRSFPFSSKIRDGVLSTIWKTLPFYVFSDVARKRSVDSHSKGITKDIESELAILRVKEYDSDMEFQMDIVNLFTQLRDGHTVYNPSCYQKFVFYLPFPLIAIKSEAVKNGKVQPQFEVRIRNEEAPYHPDLIDLWLSKHNIDISLYEGATVHKIDGQDPYKALAHIADTRYGTSRDPHARLNGALAGYKLSEGKWKLNFGMFAATTFPPEKEYVIFDVTLKNGTVTKVIAPYLAHNRVEEQFESGKEYFIKFCKAKPVDYKEVIRKAEEEEEKEKKEKEEKDIKVNKKSKRAGYKSSYGYQFESEMRSNKPKHSWLKSKFQKDISQVDLEKPVVDGDYVKFYSFNKDIGVIVIPTFDPTDEGKFKDEVITGFKKFKKLNIKKLILDVSDNGGGIVCYGYAILQYLLPKSKFKPFRLDMHVNPLLTTLLVVDKTPESSFNVQNLLRMNDTKFNDYKELLPQKKQRADVENRYTNFFHNDCRSEYFLADLRKHIDPEDTPFPLKDIVVVSNSYCYSTCGIFVNNLQETGQIMTYSIGGTPIKSDKLPTVGSMNGANVMQLNDLHLALTYFNLTEHPLSPQQFPVNATFGFTLMQAYSHFPDKYGKPIPLEFLARTADFHIYLDQKSVGDPTLVWAQLAKRRRYLDGGNKQHIGWNGFQIVDRLQGWLNNMFLGSK